jgi:hypothetical protein
MRVLVLFAAFVGMTFAFAPPSTPLATRIASHQTAAPTFYLSAVDPDAIASASLAVAEGLRDFTLFKGKTLSLVHPLMMFSLLAFSLRTAVLGFNWRRQRTIGDEISALKKSLPDLGGSSTVSDALAAAKEAEDTALVSKYQAALSTEKEINALSDERKQLAADGPRDKHFSSGALLAFLGTTFAIEVSLLP